MPWIVARIRAVCRKNESISNHLVATGFSESSLLRLFSLEYLLLFSVSVHFWDNIAA